MVIVQVTATLIDRARERLHGINALAGNCVPSTINYYYFSILLVKSELLMTKRPNHGLV
jgi:hypothetical protein